MIELDPGNHRPGYACSAAEGWLHDNCARLPLSWSIESHCDVHFETACSGICASRWPCGYWFWLSCDCAARGSYLKKNDDADICRWPHAGKSASERGGVVAADVDEGVGAVLDESAESETERLAAVVVVVVGSGSGGLLPVRVVVLCGISCTCAGRGLD